VGAMELALITEKARSLSNYILDKLLKYFQLDFYLIEVLPVNNRFLKKHLEISSY
jgi:hypothetical protein